MSLWIAWAGPCVCFVVRKLVSRKGAKTQSQYSKITLPAFHLCALAPLREVKAGTDELFDNRQKGLIAVLHASVINPVSPSNVETTNLRHGTSDKQPTANDPALPRFASVYPAIPACKASSSSPG